MVSLLVVNCIIRTSVAAVNKELKHHQRGYMPVSVMSINHINAAIIPGFMYVKFL